MRWADRPDVPTAHVAALLEAYHLRTEAEKGLAVSSVADLPARYRAEVDDPAATLGTDLLLAIDDDRLVGCVGFDVSADEPRVKRLWVDPMTRRSGAGTALVGAVMSAVAELGHRTIGLSVWSWRSEAIAVYRRLGFEVVDSWEDRDELVCMRVAL